MPDTKTLFHYISYLQYPLMLVALFYTFKPMLYGFEAIWEDYNKVLLFAGLGISFSTLQDTTKTQNKFSKKVWENPKSGKRMLIMIALSTLFFILLGLYGMFAAQESVLQELSFGVLVFGIGYMGLLKAAIEMFENHRRDKNLGI